MLLAKHVLYLWFASVDKKLRNLDIADDECTEYETNSL